MKKLMTFICLMAGSIAVQASTYYCRIDNDLFGFTEVAWDDRTYEAAVADTLGSEFGAEVTSIVPHDDGKKVNIYIRFREPHFGADSAELMIFPTSDGHRVLSVGYKIRKGEQFLDRSYGNYTATCQKAS